MESWVPLSKDTEPQLSLSKQKQTNKKGTLGQLQGHKKSNGNGGKQMQGSVLEIYLIDSRFSKISVAVVPFWSQGRIIIQWRSQELTQDRPAGRSWGVLSASISTKHKKKRTRPADTSRYPRRSNVN
jgi:hypothetical protein